MRITAEDIHVRIGAKPILEDVSLSIEPGELLGLIGPNGAGKTTLLRVAAGLRPADGGRVLYDGRSVSPRQRQALARRLAYMAQGGEAHWPLRVESIVGLGRLPYQGLFRSDASKDRIAVSRAMQRAGVAGFRERTLGTLSGGERTQVLLARALAVEADALMADEPVAALDPHHQLRVMELLKQEAELGRAVAVVLHDLSLAARFCDRIALLHRGRLLALGKPAEVLTDQKLATAYGVTALRGERDGRPYLLAWDRIQDRQPGD